MIKLNIKEILNGYRNHLFPPSDLKEKIQEVVNHRKSICNNCKLNTNNICNPSIYDEAIQDFDYQGELRKKGIKYSGCGCPLTIKQKSFHSKCPLGKWLDELTPEENKEIENI